MTNLTDTFKDESWVMLYPLATKDPSEDDSIEAPKISPILIFFAFLLLDAFIIAIFYFCYFMRTKSLKSRTDQVVQQVDKPPPYQIAVMENIYPTVSAKRPDEESSIGDLPSYDDTVIKSANLQLPQSHISSDVDLTVKMT